MARSTCPKCDNQHFEIVEVEPANSQYKVMFIQCTRCGAVVGTTDYFNIEQCTRDIKDALKKISRHIGVHLESGF